MAREIIANLRPQLVKPCLKAILTSGMAELLENHQAIERIHAPRLMERLEAALVIENQAHAQINPAVGVRLYGHG
ncbi:hypothetical protein GCM10017767_26720 [Halomonas urumqiensis]|nr:hypothetical protein GCM10017767_26720 [Halomonas urumqiensis]